MLQHAGSFKTRGAFSNLLTREVPPAGVVAASGGNHGAAVAYAAMRVVRPRKDFRPPGLSPGEGGAHPRSTAPTWSMGGERYCRCPSASEAWALQSHALPVHAFDQTETLLGAGSVAES